MGVACDVPAATYTYTFASNSKWDKFYAGGAEIKTYLSRVVEHYNLRPLIKLQHEVVDARWDGKQWNVQVKDLVSGNIIKDSADFIYYSPGLLSNPIWPDIPGRESYKGILRHSGKWDAAKEEEEGMDWSDKRVGVIGVGSSAIQIIPVMQSKCRELVSFGRSRTWIIGTYGDSILASMGIDPSKQSNYAFTDAEKEYLANFENYKDFRMVVEREMGLQHFLIHRDTKAQNGFRALSEAKMRSKLEDKPELADRLVPDFAVGCKRLTPGPGYLEALAQPNTSFVTDDLECFTPTGIRTKKGEEYQLDAIICATGFKADAKPRFPIVNEVTGDNLQDLWDYEPVSYMSVGAPRMPNFFTVLGPQSHVGTGNLLIIMEAELAYAAKCIAKCQREGIRSMTPKDSAIQDWIRYTDAYFPRTVYSTECPSWYKSGGHGTIRTLWPGSSQHAVAALREPRWEDWDYERDPQYKHSMSWLGDGQIAPHYDPAFYFDEMRSRHKDIIHI